MDQQVSRAEWQRSAAELLEHYRTVLARYGVAPGPDLRLEVDESTPYSYCDLQTGRISLNLPGTDRFPDLFLLISVGSLLGTKEPVRFLRSLLPYLLGHELAHYLRERHGALSANHWVEEHAANRVGMALACTVPAFVAEQPFLRSLAEGAREHLPLREGEVIGALRETHATAVAEVEAFVRLTGAGELDALRAAGLEAEVALLGVRQEQVAAEFNQSYMTDALTYMRRQLAWFCAQVLEPEPLGLGPALEAHLLTPSWEERMAAESAAALARLAAAGTGEGPAWSREELLSHAAGADDRLRALALERLADSPADLRGVLERAAGLCDRYARLEASAAEHGAPKALREALADAHGLAREVGAEAAGSLAGVPLHVVRAGLASHSGRAAELTLRLIRRGLSRADRALAEPLRPSGPASGLPGPMAEPDFRQSVLTDPDPLVATAAGATDRLDGETLRELPFFRRSPLLRPLRGEELLPLARAAQAVRKAPGAVLARKGDRPTHLYLAEDGQWHGLLEVLAGLPLRRGLRLPSNRRMLCLEAPAFLEICRGEPRLSRTIASFLARRAVRPLSGRGRPGGHLPARPLLPAEKALALLETDLFAGQGGEALLQIAESFVTRFYSPGDRLAEAGDLPRLLLLLDGQVQVGDHRLGAGSVLGDAECLIGRPWREQAVALEPAVALEAESGDFLRLLHRLEGLPFQLARRQARRLVE